MTIAFPSFRRLILCSLGILLACGLGAGTSAPPDPDKASTEPRKKPALYDPKADARAQVTAATARARRDCSRVLVMFGFEACGWCHKLHALFGENPEIRKLLRDEYVTIMVDTEAPDAAELIRECKKALTAEELQKGVGYPFLAVLDADGKALTAQRTEPLEDGDHHDAAKVKDFLGLWIAPRTDARAILEAALARAAKDDKRVFLHFGAPWCGWCHRLEDFLGREEIAAVLGPDFILAKVDVDRMENGKEVMGTYRKGKPGGIPWFVFLDGNGKTLATADGPKGNIGYPARLHEIDHFIAVLKQTARRIEPAQFDGIEAALRQARTDLGLDRGP